MKVWMLILLTFSFSAYASEFTYIKLDPEFEQYLTQTKSKSNLNSNLSNKAMLNGNNKSIIEVNMKSKMASILLGAPTGNPMPADGEESLLYEEIRRHLEAAHEGIGKEQVQNINHLNQQFNLGSSNFSGFSWQKPFGVVDAYVDRQVTPNIFGSNWLVMDTFTFEAEATTFLEKLKETGLSSMSKTEIGAFAGITFKRVYTSWHYANSFQEGLASDFSKLFLPFIKFNKRGMENMNDQEVMKREDVWTARVGGLISTPPLYNLSFSAGVLAQHDYHNITTIQSNHSGEERFRVGVASKRAASAGATLQLQLDFFKLIKFSLLRYDMNYEYASGKEFKLGFNSSQWNHLRGETEEGAELRSILKGLGAVKKLEPYVVSLDESSSSALEQRGSILIWGKLNKSKTEQIRVIKDNTVHVFFKNYAQNVKVVQNFFSRIFSAVIYKILKFPVGVNNAAVYSRQLTMEYKATHPQATDPAITRIDNTEQFSFVLTQYYSAARTDRWVDRKIKNDLIWFVDNFTTLPKNYKTDIRGEHLVGPMLIESNLRVEKAGLNYLLESSENDVFGLLVKVCGSENMRNWIQEANRLEMLNQNQTGKEKCVKNLGLKFLDFKNDYAANHLKPSLVKFKAFMTKYYKQSQDITELQALFGEENTFVNGKLQAKTGSGIDFSTVFSAGQFRGLGVIDNFKRSNGTRVPASIVSE
jgi:hypothetical protein